MPIYEFQCKETGEIKEVIFPLKAWTVRQILCPIHFDGISNTGNIITHQAERISSAPANINIGKPTIIFRNPKTGETEVATFEHDTPREGFVKEELRNPIERTKFEQEAQKRRNAENEITTEYLKTQHSETRKNRHAEINAKMSTFPNDGTREFLKKVMNRKSRRKFPDKKSDVKLTVNHTDSSNLIK